MGNSVLQSGASIGAIITPQIMKLMMTDQPGSWRDDVHRRRWRWDCSGWPRGSSACAGATWIARRSRRSKRRRLRSRRHPAQRALLGGGAAHRGRAGRVAYLSRVAHEIPANRAGLRGEGGAGFQLALLHRHGCRLHPRRLRLALADPPSRLVSARCAAHGLCGSCVLTSLSVFLPWLGRGWPLLATLLLIGAGALALVSVLLQLRPRAFRRPMWAVSPAC